MLKRRWLWFWKRVRSKQKIGSTSARNLVNIR
jgi:hypothetical protein